MVKKSNIGTVTRRKMNIVICDDDMDFATTLESQIRSYAAYNDFEVNIQTFYSAKTLLSADLFNCDALFLDIDMPEITGLEAAQLLRADHPDLILIFITGWIEYAPAGYRVNAFRYLLKKDLIRKQKVIMGFNRLLGR